MNKAQIILLRLGAPIELVKRFTPGRLPDEILDEYKPLVARLTSAISEPGCYFVTGKSRADRQISLAIYALWLDLNKKRARFITSTTGYQPLPFHSHYIFLDADILKLDDDHPKILGGVSSGYVYVFESASGTVPQQLTEVSTILTLRG